MLEKISNEIRQGGAVSRRARHAKSSAMILTGALAASALFLHGLSTASVASKTIEGPDTLVLRSTSSFSLQVLSVNLGQRGIVRLRTCAAVDSLGDCKEPWKSTERRLSAEEIRVLKRLAREAKLFDGRANGGHLDLTFRWLEVLAGNDIAMLVTSLNDSFSEPGPRKDLMTRLKALEAQMSASQLQK